MKTWSGSHRRTVALSWLTSTVEGGEQVVHGGGTQGGVGSKKPQVEKSSFNKRTGE